MNNIDNIQKGKIQTTGIGIKLLLLCGIISTVFYISADIYVSAMLEGYSYVSQHISELSAIGVPKRSIIIPTLIMYNVLIVAFGLGILLKDRRKCACLLVIVLIVYAIVGMIGLNFPMHIRGVDDRTTTDSLHLALTGVQVLLIPLFIALGASLYKSWFRHYSIASILIILSFGFWAGLDAPRIAANLPTPWSGIRERISVYTTMIWILVLAIKAYYSRTNKKIR